MKRKPNMRRGVIRIGDPLSSGGQVVSACSNFKVDGKEVAGVGDACHCNRHGDVQIVEGIETFTFFGKKLALHGCKVSCGCSVISTTELMVVDTGGAGAAQEGQPEPPCAVGTQASYALALTGKEAQTDTMGEAEAKNALTAEDKKPQTGPKIVNLTGEDMYKDRSGRKYQPVRDQIATSRAYVVTSTDATFKKDVTSSASVKIVVFHSYQQTVQSPFTHVLYFPSADRSKSKLLESPIHISGFRVYVVGCGMDQKSSFGMFTFDKGAQVRGVNAAGGVGEGVIRALQWELGLKPGWGGLIWR